MSHWSSNLERFKPCPEAKKHMAKYKNPQNALKHTKNAEWLVWVLGAYEAQDIKIRLLDAAKKYLQTLPDEVRSYTVNKWERLVEPYYSRFQTLPTYELNLDIYMQMKPIAANNPDRVILNAIQYLSNSSFHCKNQASCFVSRFSSWIIDAVLDPDPSLSIYQWAKGNVEDYFADWAKAQPEWQAIIKELGGYSASKK